ncbi:SUMF1/EgtB/PvdO family nonheme iron enzyme [Planctomycetota bacterium]|nr:SUMF1/EgtB/PvdO family nonheme iron enzyme [Planctomycetota bacterium]
MASNGNTSYFVFISLFLALAVGTLVAFKMGILSFDELLMPDENSPRRGTRIGSSDPVGPDGNSSKPVLNTDDSKFDSNMPADRSLEDKWSAPLKKTIEVTRMIEGHKVKLKLRHVPQGWFQMGETNGVQANMPKKWVWASDYYLAETETTNDQYFAFISEGGYTRPRFWYSPAHKWILERGRRGSEYIGWRPLAKNGRLWDIASPHGNHWLQVNQPGTEIGLPDTQIIVVPKGDADEKWITINAKRSEVLFFNKATKKWDMIEPKLALQRLMAEKSNLVYKSDERGRVDLSKIKARKMNVIAYIDGDNMPPVFVDLARVSETKLSEPEMPVVSISWFEADACSRYWGGTLPWEFQWEKAARGTDGRAFPWGNDLEQTLKFKGRMSTKRANFNRHGLTQVGTFPTGAGPYGHLDLTGNVSEWCRDVFMRNMLADERFKKPDPFIQGAMQSSHSERGANSDDDDASVATGHYRRSADPYTLRNTWRGFRMAFTPDQAYDAAGLKLPAKN